MIGIANFKGVAVFFLQPIVVAAIPLTLQVIVSTLPNTQCLDTLDAADSSPRLRFNASHFTANLLDHFGNNANLVPNITVRVKSPPTHGQIFLVNDLKPDNLTLVSEFRFRDLWRVVYMLGEAGRTMTGDQLVLEFGYGHSEVVVHTLSLCILPILVPLSFQTVPLELTQGGGGAEGVGPITTLNLLVTASREEDIDSLYFEVVRGPLYGVLLDERLDTPVTRFSHSDLSSGSIVYVYHNASGPSQDDAVFNVCSAYRCLGEQVLEVRVYPVDLVVRNTTIRIKEGGLHQFTLRDFNISAPRNYRVFVAVDKPNYGQIVRISTVPLKVPAFYLEDVEKGLIYYNNTILEHLHDCFDVLVEATPPDVTGMTMVMEFLMRIDIEPVNNHAPEIVRTTEKLTVVQGSSALIPSSLLSAHDSDAGTDDDDLLWINDIPLYFPILGYIFIANGSEGGGQAVFRWTEGDIRNNRLYYQHNSDQVSTLDHLFFTVSDGQKNDSYLLRIEIVAVAIVKCSVSKHTPFQLEEGRSRQIMYEYFRFCANNDDSLGDSNFEIFIAEPPRYGNLTLNNSLLRRGVSFTQDQIAFGQLVYHHDNSNTERDNFTFNVSVPIRQNSFIMERFDIVVAAIDDDPPVVIINGPLFVIQGARVDITNTTIQIIDDDSRTVTEIDKVECQIVQGLSQGQLGRERFDHTNEHTLNFTKYDLDHGMLWYQHLQRPPIVEAEQLIFNVTDGINHQAEIYNLTIIVLPRVLTLHVGRLGVTEEEMALITAEEIVVSHHYLRTVGGTITVLTPPLHGQLLYIGNTQRQQHGPLTNFTTEEMANRSIAYYHNGDDSLADSFEFTYMAREPAHYNRKSDVYTLHIDITPVDDNPPTLVNNRTVLKMWANDMIVLEEKYLNITDYDTAPSKLIITVSIMGLGGHLAFANATSVSIHSFTQADLRARRVKFRHVDGRKGKLLYNVTDSVETVSGTISIFADPLELECDTTQWAPIQVDFLGTTPLAPRNLHCTTSDEVTNREFYFTISEATLGHFEVDSLPVLSFNSTALAAGLVTYVHTETGLWREGETLSVSVESHPATSKFGLALNVTVSYPQPPASSRLAVNPGLLLQEGGYHSINLEVLDGRNLRYEAWLGLDSREVSPSDLVVEYRLQAPPENGSLTLNASAVEVFTQALLEQDSTSLLYTHDGSESLTDTLQLDVAVTLNGTLVAEYRGESVSVTVTPVNDHPPLLYTPTLEKSLVQHHQTFLSTEDLEIRDLDSGPEQIVLVLMSVPNNTHMSLGAAALGVNSSFPQSAIDQERIFLEPHTMGTSTFSFTFSDGALASEGVLNFTLVVAEHTLELVTFQEVTYTQNQRGTVIGKRHLDTYTNGLRSRTHFMVTRAPHYGRIMIEESEVQNFTQLDVDDSRVKYVPHRGARKHTDDFSLNITNRELSQQIEVSVRVLAWGKTNYSSNIDFSGPDRLSQPLPPDVLILDQQVSDMGYLPIIMLLSHPNYGHLEMRVPLHPDIVLTKRFTGEIETFTSNDLQRGWIVYVWDFPEPVYNVSVEESFVVLVEFDGMQPGEAVIQMTVYPPSPPASPQQPSTVSHTTTPTPPGTDSPAPTAASEGSGFPVYILIPIIGIILFLLILIIVVVVFCLTQQKRIKKKWAPSLSPPRHQSPWSSASPPIPMHTTHYDYDPSAMPMGGDHDINNSDTSSGFSEPEISPRHTPVRSMYSSPHPHATSPTFHPPRSRMRRNVSITFSSHHSTASEMSLEPGNSLHSSLSQYPPQAGAASGGPITLPARPASHTAFNRPSPAMLMDSGVVSLQSHPGNYSLSRELSHTPPEEPKPPESSVKADLAEWTAGEGVPDFSDPNVQRLFHTQNPVLKKEEYWV